MGLIRSWIITKFFTVTFSIKTANYHLCDSWAKTTVKKLNEYLQSCKRSCFTPFTAGLSQGLLDLFLGGIGWWAVKNIGRICIQAPRKGMQPGRRPGAH